MLPRERPDRIHVAFDDHRLVANAGLILPVTLAHHLGLGELVDRHVDLGGAPGRANVGDKMLTLVASALAGGDCIDDADALRAGGTDRVLGCVVKAPSSLGTFQSEFPVGSRAPAGSGEPGAAGPSLDRWGRTWRRTVDHRPGLHHLRNLRAGQGGGARPRLHRPAGLSPATGHCRRNRRRADAHLITQIVTQRSWSPHIKCYRQCRGSHVDGTARTGRGTASPFPLLHPAEGLFG